ncbi:hypothetical protein Pmani_024287 [Petrolisthes manimaculis]|uniref:Uncharacterized protein n=1 Tax=Petrolisthes manimaculis TaxID=1843537 RepID=A0AAE1PAP4_9EUCA|nr:hypothetical protein Pmani_024287 [Petrolisthes manimaculis]
MFLISGHHHHHHPVHTLPWAGAACRELYEGVVDVGVGVGVGVGGGETGVLETGVVTQVYSTLGELPAVLVASTLLLDLILIPAIAARGGSEYVAWTTNFSLSGPSLPSRLQDTRYLAPHPDLLAALFFLPATIMVLAGTKIACRAGVGVGVSVGVVVLTAASCTACFSSDLQAWTSGLQNVFSHDLQQASTYVVGGAAVVTVGVGGGQHGGLLTGECYRSRTLAARLGVGVGVAAILLLLPVALAFTLAQPGPTFTATLAHLLPQESAEGMQVLMGVGGVVGLWAGAVGGLLCGSRLVHNLGWDGLVPRGLGKVSRLTATPWPATLLCGTAAALIAALCPSQLLLRAAGSGGLSCGVAGAAAVLAYRYQPKITHRRPPDREYWMDLAAPSCSGHNDTLQHPTLDEDDMCRVAVQWKGGTCKSSLVEPPSPPTWTSWGTSRFLVMTFIINCVAGAAVVRWARHLHIGMWAWAGVALCVGGCVVCGVGLWLQPCHPKPRHIQVDTNPVLPLLTLMSNLVLLLHLPQTALVAACGVWAAAVGAWLLWGRTESTEAALRRALLTHPVHSDLL